MNEQGSLYAIKLGSVSEARRIMQAYAKDVGVEPCQDGSFEYKDVVVGCSSDPWSDEVEIEFAGQPGNTERVFRDFAYFTGIKETPDVGKWVIVDEAQLFGSC